jgi:hypothetical protein
MVIWPVVGKKGDKDIDIGLGTELSCSEVGRAALTGLLYRTTLAKRHFYTDSRLAYTSDSMTILEEWLLTQNTDRRGRHNDSDHRFQR